MRALTPWRPARALTSLHDEFDDLFSRFFGTEGGESRHTFSGELFEPAVDTEVRDGKMVVTADLPGIDPKSVDVSVSGDRLTIKGERKAEHEENQAGRFYREVRYGRFERTLRLPGPIDPGTVTAKYRDGVLDISMKAPAGSEPTRVPVTTA
jgi:HSP20 family protein